MISVTSAKLKKRFSSSYKFINWNFMSLLYYNLDQMCGNFEMSDQTIGHDKTNYDAKKVGKRIINVVHCQWFYE